MEKGIHIIHGLVWGPGTLALFLIVGFFLTVRYRGYQFRRFPQWWRETAGSFFGSVKEQTKQGDQSFSQLQSACTALAATIGTGNIVGVATALTVGGPGALFWMWISAFIGMMTAYAETALGMKYRYQNPQGQWVAGPMVYIERGLGKKGIAVVYAFFCLLSSLGMGSMVQANSMTATLNYQFNLKPVIPSILITIVVFIILKGGVTTVAKVTERMIPWAAGIYIVFGLTVVASCYDQWGAMMTMIIQQAFAPQAALGGATGYSIQSALRYGMARGVFSNEAGLGSLAVLHGNASDPCPRKQGKWAMFEVFFDTIVICTLTGLVILCMTDGGTILTEYDGAALTAWCFARRLGVIGKWLICAAMLVFAFATILAWYHVGRQVVLYLLNRIKWLPGWLERVYLLVYLGAVCYGGIGGLNLVWELSDIWNGGMAVLNLLALLVLHRQVPDPDDGSE